MKFNLVELEKKYMLLVMSGKLTLKQAKTMLRRAQELNYDKH